MQIEADLSKLLLVFSRLLPVMILLPGSNYFPSQIKLILTLLIAFLLSGLIQDFTLISFNSPVFALFMIGKEVIIGFFLGSVNAILFSALHLMGHIISMQIGLSMLTLFNPEEAQQDVVTSKLLSLMGICLLFLADGHLLIVRIVAASYDLFPLNSSLDPQDSLYVVFQSVTESFYYGLKLSMTFIGIGLICSIVSGIITKLVRNINAFFMVMPVQVIIGLFFAMITIGLIMESFISYYLQSLNNYAEKIFVDF